MKVNKPATTGQCNKDRKMLRSVGGSARVTGAQRRGESASETAQGEGALVWEGGRSYSFRFSGRSSSQAGIWKVNVDVPEEEFGRKADSLCKGSGTRENTEHSRNGLG